MRTNGVASRDEAQIRALIDARVWAVQAKDVARALACVDVDVVVFDVVAPLCARGADAERVRLEE